MDKIHIFYKTTNLINGCTYYGIHSTTNLDDGYLGSGKIIKLAIIKYGDQNFKRETIKTFKSRNEAFEYEKLFVNTELVQDPNVYNITEGGNGVVTHSAEGLQNLSDFGKNKVAAKDLLTNEMVRIPKSEFDSNPERYVGVSKGKKVMKNGDNVTVIVDVDNTDPTLTGHTKGKMVVIGKDGKGFMINIDDPRVLSGELISPSKGKISVKDKMGNCFVISSDDPRFKSGELVGIAKGKRYKRNKKRREFTCPHCQKTCDPSNAKRWHFDNCKNKSKLF
jgi:hypothetical protein